MDFVDHEQRGPTAGRDFLTGLLQNLAHILDAAGDGAELTEATLGFVSEQTGERGLADAGWTVKDDGAEPAGAEHSPQQFAFAKKMLLADEFGERLGPHARGERLDTLPVFFLARGE